MEHERKKKKVRETDRKTDTERETDRLVRRDKKKRQRLIIKEKKFT